MYSRALERAAELSCARGAPSVRDAARAGEGGGSRARPSRVLNRRGPEDDTMSHFWRAFEGSLSPEISSGASRPQVMRLMLGVDTSAYGTHPNSV